MRKWKKCLLLAAGMAAALSTAAMASQDKSDMVTVEVKNCKGGAIEVECQYPEDMDEDSVYLPIGEKVQVPKGSSLWIDAWTINFYSEKDESWIDSYPKSVHIIQNGKDNAVATEWAGSDIVIDEWEIQGDCIIEADYVAEIDAQGIGEDWDAIPDENRSYSVYGKNTYYDSPSMVNVDLIAKIGSKSIDLSEIPELEIGSTRTHDDGEWYHENFELTETGIKSKEVLPLGRYRIPISYKSRKDGGFTRIRYAMVYVGKSATADVSLAEYEEDGEWQSIGGGGAGILNPDADPDAPLKQQRFFDAAKTKVSDVMKLFSQKSFNSIIAGYTHNGEFVDENGKTVNNEDSRSLSEAAGKKKSTFSITPVLKKENKTYKPIRIKTIPESEAIVKYSDSWVEKDGKLYYYVDTYGEDCEWHGNKLASGEWVKRGGQDVYCDKTGALVTKGIAGTKIDDAMGLWLVNEKGYKRTDYSGEYTVGMNKYTVKDGKVTDIEIVEEVEAPASVTSVEKFTDGLELVVNNDAVASEQKAGFAGKLVTGMNNLTDAQKNTLADDVIAKADEALTAAYSNVNTTVEKAETEEFEENEQLKNVSAKGLLAAAGLTSANEANSVTLQIAQTASNALMKFDAKLYVGDDENPTQLKSPVIMEVELPEDVQKMYSKYGYTYKLVHTGEDGTKDIVTDGQKKNGLSLELSADMKTAKIRTNSFSTFELQATRNNNNIINTPDDSTTPVTPSKPSNGNNSGNNGNSGNGGNNNNSSYSDSDNSDESGTQSTTYRRKKTDAAGQWVQDAKGWWYRRADGSWPKSQWVELGWNGVNSWYYFNESGYMVTGWKEDGGYTYYLNPVSDGTSGQMFTGWHQIDSIWYYFNTLTGGPQGSLVKNGTTPDGYKVGADGAWIR